MKHKQPCPPALSSMATPRSARAAKPGCHRLHASAGSRLPAGVAAFLITLAAGPVAAAVDDLPIPREPLSAGSSVPPNVLLILDDSGSMRLNFLTSPGVTRITSPRDGRGQIVSMKMNDSSGAASVTPTYNTLAYNPRLTYRPWRKADGSYMPEMKPEAAAGDHDLASPSYGAMNLLSRGFETRFYVPRAGITNTADLTQYTQYKLHTWNDAEECTTAERNAQGYWKNPDRDAYGQQWPEGSCQKISSFTWTLDDGSTVTRSLAEEWRNYANWFGYHRTRMKATKAVVSEVFSGLAGDEFRMGYANLNKPHKNLDIPVWSAGGLFKDIPTARSQNRTEWFNRMFLETSTGDTPLRSALRRAGEYFSRRDADGPWGPGSPAIPGEQIACRQNFVILATDGEWTSESDEAIVSGNTDGSGGYRITAPDGRSYQYQPSPPYADDVSATLADAAMRYWKHDLRTDMDNVVPASRQNPAFWQHMVTSTISIGVQGSLDPVADLPGLISGKTKWPRPGARDVFKTDDLFHASVNGRGTYANAMDPQALSEGLTDALSAIGEQVASSARPAFDSGTLEAGGRSFVASYLPGPWSGDLKAYAVTSTGVSSTLVWSAVDGIPEPGQRRLYTHATPGQPGKRPTLAFPTDDQKALLTEDVAAWLRGDRSLEGVRLRTRDSVLGDIVHSAPVHVKTAGAEVVLVGANDGMLHVFDAVHGKELLAYVPGLLDMRQLKELSRPRGFRHRYFVDGPLTAVRTDRRNGIAVVGTLGRGGRGVYGLSLDLAHPDRPPSSWEFTDDSGMGLVLSRPQLTWARNRNGQPVLDAVLVSNGINSPDGEAALYVLDAATGKLRGKIPAGYEPRNGLSAPALLDLDGDGQVDRAYAGDLNGNVWRFDLTGSASQWRATRIFIATDVRGNRQTITGGMGVALHPVTGRPWVFFGTGSYLTSADASDMSIQSWYGVEDGSPVATRKQLRTRRIVVTGTIDGKPVRAFEKAKAGDMNGTRGWVVDLRTPGIDPEGERMIGESQQIIGGNTLLAASMAPTGGGCGGKGRGYLNAIDPFTGGATSFPFFDVNGDGKFDGKDGVSGTPAGSIDLGLGMISDPGILLGKLTGGTADGGQSRACVSGASGTTDCVAFNTGGPKGRYGRVAWFEHTNE